MGGGGGGGIGGLKSHVQQAIPAFSSCVQEGMGSKVSYC